MFMFIRFLTHSSVFVKHKCKKFTYHSTFQNCSKTFGHPYCHVTIHKDLGISPWKSRLWRGMLLYLWHVFFYEMILQFTKHCYMDKALYWSYIHFNQRRASWPFTYQARYKILLKQESRNFETMFYIVGRLCALHCMYLLVLFETFVFTEDSRICVLHVNTQLVHCSKTFTGRS